MAGEEASADHKRKLEGFETDALDPPASSNGLPDGAVQADDVAESDAKRPRLGDFTDGLESRENGSPAEKPEEQHDEENQKETEEPNEGNQETRESDLLVEEAQEPTQTEEIQAVTVGTQEQSADDPKMEDNQQSSEANNAQVAAKGETKETDDENPLAEANESLSTTRKIDVPSSKVGVLIGKGGETIRYLQFNSGAKIQILRDAEADPDSSTRPVELIGALVSIEKAEKLIQAVIAEADAGGSPSLIARGLAITQATGGAEQIEIQVPNDKVGLIIGRRGETIKSMQAKSGARIQLIQQHPDGAGSQERTVRISGNKMQIEMATEMMKDVMNQTIRPLPLSGGFNQPAYQPRGPTGPSHWGSRGPHAGQPIPYDYHHRGPYPPQSSPYHPQAYGGYPPQHMPPRSSFGVGWDQRPPHSSGYDYYGRQGSQISAPLSTPASGHAPGPLPSPTLGGPPPSHVNYNYGQAHASEYGHGAPYSQTVPQQNYGHMYEQQPKYDNPPPIQQPYGGGSQPGYPQTGGQPGFTQPQQYVKPYGMQGPNPQTYGPPRAAPADIPYQGVAPSAQSYGPNVAPQQQYPYTSSGPVQQSYPSYGSVAPSDGYNQQLPATASGYQQQGVQPGYGQQATSGAYGSYPSSQQAYTEQPAQHNGSYAYQGSQDPSYGGGSGSAYAAATTAQQAYPQVAQAQPVYDQSATQSAGYGAAPGNVPVKSPQPGYPQYDANQVYAAPR